MYRISVPILQRLCYKVRKPVSKTCLYKTSRLLSYATPDNLKSQAGRRVISKKGKSYEEWINTPESEIFNVMMRQEKVKWYRTVGLPLQQAAQHQRIIKEKSMTTAIVLLTAAHYYNK